MRDLDFSPRREPRCKGRVKNRGVVNVMDTPTLNPSPKMREGLQWRKTPLPSLVAGDGGMSSIFTTP